MIRLYEKGFVYFFQSYCQIRNQWGPLKIGFSKYPDWRIRSLYTSIPTSLYPLAVIPGTRFLEKALHEKFKKNRLWGEWFTVDRDLMKFIRDIRRQEGAIADWMPKVREFEENIMRGENACA